MKSALILPFVFAFTLFITSCSDDEPIIPPSDMPIIPPVSTMVIDFTDFAENAINPSGGRVATLENWGRSAFTVVFWNAVVVVNLAVPVTAFAAAINQTPEFDFAQGVWAWTYNFEVTGVAHSARLTAKIGTASNVQWAMYITRDGDFQDFLWYTGESNVAGTEGSWNLQSNPNNPTPFIDIEWSRSNDGEIGEIRYTNIIPGDDDNGGYLEYGLVDDPDFDAFYNLLTIETGNIRQIQWNRESKAGRIKDPAHYNDQEFHCWGEDLMDIDC